MEDWVQPASKEVAYPLDAVVRHNGAIWQSTLKDNETEPGTAGSFWNLIEQSIRTRALDAYNAEQDAWMTEAKAALQLVVGVDGVDNMDLVDTQITEAFHLAIWSDNDVTLATRRNAGQEWQVMLVAFEDGWTDKSGPLESLADLGEALAEAG